MERPTLSEVIEFVEERIVWYEKAADIWRGEKRHDYEMYDLGKKYALIEALEFLKGERK